VEVVVSPVDGDCARVGKEVGVGISLGCCVDDTPPSGRKIGVDGLDALLALVSMYDELTYEYTMKSPNPMAAAAMAGRARPGKFITTPLFLTAPLISKAIPLFVIYTTKT
jgi:hypothetical protein